MTVVWILFGLYCLGMWTASWYEAGEIKGYERAKRELSNPPGSGEEGR